MLGFSSISGQRRVMKKWERDGWQTRDERTEKRNLYVCGRVRVNDDTGVVLAAGDGAETLLWRGPGGEAQGRAAGTYDGGGGGGGVGGALGMAYEEGFCYVVQFTE